MPETSTSTLLPTRGDIVAALDLTLPAVNAAWQGSPGAALEWAARTDSHDLDLWCADAAVADVDEVLTALGASAVSSTSDPARLRHVSYAVPTPTGLALVDVTRGDLRVGPVLLVPEEQITADAGSLTGVAAAADLFLRPMLRGRIVDGDRLRLARDNWAVAPETEQRRLGQRLADQLGSSVAREALAALAGAHPQPTLARRARLALAAASLRPRNARSTWAQRRTILPARKAAGPLGLRTRGVTVVLVGTDGSGKSTVADRLSTRLVDLGVPTASAYFGMARGNLPGIALARKVLGVAPTTESADRPAVGGAQPEATSHSVLRRIAAWYYAGEYVVRWFRDVRPHLRRGTVVICDRYVFDLRESPWPGSRAAAWAERILPRPDVLVLPDAPDAEIHARKPERPAAEQAAQQARFRALLGEPSVAGACVTVDTSGASSGDTMGPVVAAALVAMHR